MFLNRGVGLGEVGIMSKRYPKEFRDDVVRVARTGDTKLSQSATDFGVLEASIYNWMKQADVNDDVRPGLTDAEAEELRYVKRRNRVLEEENLILRRAAAFFAKNISQKSCTRSLLTPRSTACGSPRHVACSATR